MRPARRGPAARLAVTAVLGLSLATGCSGPPPDPDPTPQRSGNPLAGSTFYVDPAGHAPTQERAWQQDGHDAEQLLLGLLADRPTATWFTGGEADLTGQVRALTSAAAAASQVPVLVAYAVPGRDCGSFSGGGAADDAAYLDWVQRLADGIGGREAVVVLEPDAVPHALDDCLAQRGTDPADRLALLHRAVDVLTADPATHVYLDAGNAGWVEDLDALAGALDAAGVRDAAGFSLNVANFETTAASTAYGTALSDRLGGAHFVVDTSRNGSGPPAPDGQGLEWCNPTGRTVGAVPTSDTGTERTDAYLWVKVPGDSDGQCRPGEPPAGTWWPDYALDLVMQTQMGHPWSGHSL